LGVVTRAFGVPAESAIGKGLIPFGVQWANSIEELVEPLPANQRLGCVVLRGPAENLLAHILVVRESVLWVRVPVVCVLRPGEHNQVATCRRAGAAFCFVEPVDARSVANAVRANLEQRGGEPTWSSTSPSTDNYALAQASELAFRVRTPKDAEAVAGLLARACPQPARQALGISELLLNAVEHGNFEIDGTTKAELLEAGTFQSELERRISDPLYADREANVWLRRSDDRIELMCEDPGPGFDWQKHLLPRDASTETAPKPCGWGIHLARSLAFDSLEYVGRGNIVVARVFNVRSGRRTSADEVLSTAEQRILELEVDRVMEQTLDEHFFDAVLNLALRITQSIQGFVGRVHEDGAVTVAARSRHAMADCTPAEALPDLTSPPWGGTWRTVVGQRITCLRNAEVRVIGPTLANALGVPILYRGRLLGMLHVAGRETHYAGRQAQKLEVLARRLSPLLAARISNDQANERRAELEIKRSLELSEQELARRLVSGMLREGCLDAPGIRALMSAKDLFNGDLALAASLPDGSLRWMLGDFVGHGLPAAIGGLPVASVFYATARKEVPLTEVVMTINDSLRAALPHGFFCAAVILECSANGHQLRCWNAGMPSVLLRSAGSQTVRQIASHSVPLGVVASEELQSQLQVLNVALGDRVVCMSDGIVETSNPHGELFGQERAVAALSQGNAATAFDTLLSSLSAFRGAAVSLDDVSAIEVTVGLARTSTSFARVRPD
jgi:serine phosphatase RsbU (regulator of sigma subunit)/anti-sigma regulatory factor (Ser/Thr protein kinase)